MAGIIKTNVVQLGDSGTPDNNFFLKTNGDGSASLVRGNNPTGTNILTVSAAGKVDIQSSLLQSATAVASTSGTSIDFTGLPSWVKRITVMFSGVSTNGTSNYLIQLGDSGGIENTGYLGASSLLSTGAATTNYTTGFGIRCDQAAAVVQGAVILTNITGNTWAASGVTSRSDTVVTHTTSGNKTLSATLDHVRITTVNGTDTFDAGSINIMWE
jgi:hypothetical protein